ncbi:BnaCnng28780D [Brassica napus]|uniref:BnaCnng28780D protein n=1 Tax=Brassica napus TaxID=3708 RepID=A0A078IYL3_BRANA|nr:BnaCnng28780D [Brassica napus]
MLTKIHFNSFPFNTRIFFTSFSLIFFFKISMIYLVIRLQVIVSLLRPAPSPDWAEILAHILRTAHDSLASILLRLAFQVTVYYIWRERNEEDIHNEVDQPISLQNEVYVKRHSRLRDTVSLLSSDIDLGKIFQSAKTASESDPLARIEPQKLDENGRDYDDDASTSPKSNEASLSLPTEPKSPYIEEPKLADEQLKYYFPRPAPPLGAGKHTISTGYY